MKKQTTLISEIAPIEKSYCAATRINSFIYPKAPTDFQFSSFPYSGELSDLPLLSLSSSGSWPIDHFPEEKFRNILAKGKSLSEKAFLSISIHFEEREPPQSGKYHDRLGLLKLESDTGWSFSGKSAKEKSSEDCLAIIKDVIEIANLPIRVLDKGDSIYSLEYQKNGIFLPKDWQRHPKINPAGFVCYLDQPSTDDQSLLLKMQKILRKVGSGRVFEASWNCSSGRRKDDPAAAELAYQTVAKNKDIFSSETQQVHGSMKLDNVSPLEALRRICKPKDFVRMPIAHLEDFEGDTVHIEIETTAKGHRLIAKSRGGFDYYELEDRLGVRFL